MSGDIRTKLKVARRSLKIPTHEYVAKYINHILTQLEIDQEYSKIICISALILIERTIEASQDFTYHTFKRSKATDLYDIIYQSMPQTDDRMLDSFVSHIPLGQQQALEHASDLTSFKPLRPLFQITVYNWRPVVLTSIVLAMKM